MAELEENSIPKPPIKTIPAQDASSDETEQATKDGPSASHCPESQPTPQHQCYSNNPAQPPNGWWLRWDNWKRMLEVGAFFLGLFFAWVYHGQWKEMKETTQATRHAVCVAQKTLEETQKYNTVQYAQAAASLKATVDQFHLDQRAWVFIGEPETIGLVDPNKNKGLPGRIVFSSVNARITNTGKTPALRMRQEAFVVERDWIGHPQPPDYDKELAKLKRSPNTHGPFSIEGEILTPSGSQTVSVIPEELGIKILGRENRRPGINPPGTVYILGKFTYYDIFTTKQHTTKFCLWSEGGKFQICSEGNGMD